MYTCKVCALEKPAAYFPVQAPNSKGDPSHCNMCAAEVAKEKKHQQLIKRKVRASLAKVSSVQSTWLSPLSYNIKEL
jgi:hypothetical protein